MSKRNKKKRSPAPSKGESSSSGISGRNALLKIGAPLVILVLSVIGFGSLLNLTSPIISKPFSPKAAPAQPLPTPQYTATNPSKEYTYANGKLIALSEPTNIAPADLAVWRVSTGTWWVLDQDGSNTTETFGLPTDKPAPGDYDGDGKTDFCVYRASEGNWYMLYSGSSNTFVVHTFGLDGDKPVQADFNGDGKTELALFRTSNSTWYLQDTTQGYLGAWAFGANGDAPVPSDYDGDGKADIAIWRDSTATWYVLQSSDGTWGVQQWGVSGDKPVPGDYDGDGRTDHAVWQANNGWYIRRSSTGTAISPIQAWGYQASDKAVQGDYDADGKTDIGVWRGVNGTWYIIESTRGQRIQQWGTDGDFPVPAPYRR